MFEKREKSPQSRRRLRVGGVLETLGLRKRVPVETEEERQEWSRQQRRSRLDALPAGPGLKDYDLDLGLFQYSTDMSDLTSGSTQFYDTFDEIISRYRQEGRDIEEQFYDDSEKNPFEAAMFSSAAQSRPSERLSRWLEAHIPQNGYFTPEMIVDALRDNQAVSVVHDIADGIERWTFSDEQGGQFTLSRAADKTRPSVRTVPYLAVGYSPEYDFGAEEIVAVPKLRVNGYNREEREALRGSLGQSLQTVLGIEPVRLQQKLEFQVVDAKPVPYLRSADVHSLESITAQAYVVADLPDHATE